MTAPLEPAWTFRWSGHPSGFPRSVHVFFRDDSAPTEDDAVAWARELADRVQEATTEGQFNNAVLTFAEGHHLRVVQVVHGPDHRYPGGDVVTVTFDVELQPTVNIAD